MRISKISAQQIVEEIGELVRQNINLMDEHGIIIASNDPLRIGSFHQGAYQIIQEQLPELYITPELEKELGLIRQGINLPIKVEGKVEGVIGITGSYDEVASYGRIVQKMAEILIGERLRLDAERLDLRIRSRFLEDWVLSDNLANRHTLAERGLALGIDIRQPRRCMIFSVRDLSLYTKTFEGQQILEQAEATVERYMTRYPGTIILRNAARQILLVNQRPTSEMLRIAQNLIDHLNQKFDTRFIVGVDGESADLHTAYLQANRAWQVAPRHKTPAVSYENLDIELIFDRIPVEEKAHYLYKIFRDCPIPRIREYAELLDAYFESQGSLTAAAEKLYIHRNTLQYRLRQLADLTGLDARKPSQAPMLYVALQFFRDLELEKKL